MTLHSIIEMCQEVNTSWWIILIIVVTSLIDISKLPINPWKWLGKLLKKGLKELGSIAGEDVRKDFYEFKRDYTESLATHAESYQAFLTTIEEITTNVQTISEQYNTLQESVTNLSDINADIQISLESIDDQLGGLRDKLYNHVAESMRRDILDFQNSCINKRKHTKEEFTYIYTLCDKYERHIEENNLDNSEAEEAIAYIRKVYRECLENGDFIVGGGLDENP